jgi:hypothetical protein
MLNVKDLIKGEIYYGKDGSKDVIFKPNECEIYENKNFYNGNAPSALKELRRATKQEKHWLSICITKNTFISYDKAMETFKDSLLEKARRDYPIGTEYIDVQTESLGKQKATKNPIQFITGEIHVGIGFIYFNNYTSTSPINDS